MISKLQIEDTEQFEEMEEFLKSHSIVGKWRWGSEHEAIYEIDGKFYSAYYRTQPEMGLDDCNSFPLKLTEVEPYTETITKYKVKNAT